MPEASHELAVAAPRFGNRFRSGTEYCSLAVLAAAALLGSLARPMPLLLIWNASASTPTGLYFIDPFARVRRDDMVVAWAPEEARRLAAARGYLPYKVPLVKDVASAAGERVCASGRALRLGGRRIAFRQLADRAGRALPRWNGCRRLAVGELLLLGERPDSFDSRYFGPVGQSALVGRAMLLWHA